MLTRSRMSPTASRLMSSVARAHSSPSVFPSTISLPATMSYSEETQVKRTLCAKVSPMCSFNKTLDIRLTIQAALTRSYRCGEKNNVVFASFYTHKHVNRLVSINISRPSCRTGRWTRVKHYATRARVYKLFASITTVTDRSYNPRCPS